MEKLKSTKVSRDCTNKITIKHPKDSLLADRSHARLQSAAAKGVEVRNGDLWHSDDSFVSGPPTMPQKALTEVAFVLSPRGCDSYSLPTMGLLACILCKS